MSERTDVRTDGRVHMVVQTDVRTCGHTDVRTDRHQYVHAQLMTALVLTVQETERPWWFIASNSSGCGGRCEGGSVRGGGAWWQWGGCGGMVGMGAIGVEVCNEKHIFEN